MPDEAKARRRGGPATLFFTLFGVFVLLFLLPFSFGVRFYRMPSGSMLPAVYVGDHIMVTKWSYGYGRYSFAPFPGPGERVLGRAPQRGDIAVFRPTPEPDRDFVKRVVGLPGDRIQMIDGVLHINGEAVQLEPLGEVSFTDDAGGTVRTQAYRETLPGGASYMVLDRMPDGELDNTRVFVVPEGSYFVLGDDRDNSADSRVPTVIGFVPARNFIGPVAWVMETSRSTRVE